MSLFIEFHLIQNFAPSNLNRDDVGAPKDALFGGHRRARISSQCLKRAMRQHFTSSPFGFRNEIGIRTRHLDRVLETELKSLGIPNPDAFNEIVKLALKSTKGKEGADKEAPEEKLLSYLLYLSTPEIGAFQELIRQHADILTSLAGKKKLKPTDIPEDLREAIKDCLKQSKAVDIALFGRMLADLPEVNQDAACQVAHALSTHRVEREFDYFTAVDDKGDEGESGAGMIGQVEFNSATFYRYAVIDVAKLVGNLQKDRELALDGISAFAQAMARAIPSGKQNSFAAHNPPSFVGVVLRHTSPINLANAFEKPVWPSTKDELTGQSVARLADHEAKVAAFYGDGKDQWAVLDMTGSWPLALGEAPKNLDALAQWVRDRVELELGA